MNLSSKLICEFVGTFALCFVGGAGVISAKASGAPESTVLMAAVFSHALVLFVFVAATINISGAHFNPSVTIALWFNKRIQSKDALSYIATQFVAACAAGAVLAVMAVYGGSSEAWTNAARESALGNPTFDTVHLVLPAVIGIEAILTFFLVFVIWGTAVDKRSPGMGPLAIGLVVGANIFAAGGITGASMNPARSFGPGFVTSLLPGNYLPQFWTLQIAYIAGPIIGALLAGFLYEKCLMPKPKAKAPPHSIEPDA